MQGFGHQSDSPQPRCEALAQSVQFTLRKHSLAGYMPSLVTVCGGALSGPGVVQETVLPGGNDHCQPVAPQTSSLRPVTSATQVLHAYSGLEGTIPGSDNLQDFGGRTAFTPVVTVVYDDEDDTRPDVNIFCMHLRSPEGYELPFRQLNYKDDARGVEKSGAGLVQGPTILVMTIAVALAVHFM